MSATRNTTQGLKTLSQALEYVLRLMKQKDGSLQSIFSSQKSWIIEKVASVKIQSSVANNISTRNEIVGTLDKRQYAETLLTSEKKDDNTGYRTSPDVSQTTSSFPLLESPPELPDTSEERTLAGYLSQLYGSGWRFSSSAKVVEKPVPEWKLKKHNVVSQTSIDSRTKHVVTHLAQAHTEIMRLKRIKDLCHHIHKYPQAKNLAVKSGAIPCLLRQRQLSHDGSVLSFIRESLALLGYVEHPHGPGVCILAIDGGGVRGLIAIELLRRIEQITQHRIYELFDFICGVSTGAVLAVLLGPLKKSLDDCEKLYHKISAEVFTQNSWYGAGQLVWRHSYYNTSTWEKLLQETLGDTVLIKTTQDPYCPKVALLSTVINQPLIQAYVFRNYNLARHVQSQYVGGSGAELWEAVRASAAAPGYFEEYRHDGYLHQDGGILTNNPSAVALHECRHLWPTYPVQCLVSLGTGRYLPVETSKEDVASSSWKTKFLRILDSATDTEAVHTILHDLLPANRYFRFNPYLSQNTTLDETNMDTILQGVEDAQMYARKNEQKIEMACQVLLQPKPRLQQLQEWAAFKKTLMLSQM